MLGLLVTFICGGIVYSYMASFNRIYLSDWLSVSGEIVKSEMNVTNAKRGECWKPVVDYLYRVNDIEFRSFYIRSGVKETCYYRENEAKKALAKYPVGETVEVFFQADNPEVGVLLLGMKWSDLYLFLMFLLGTVAGVTVIFVKLPEGKRELLE